MPNLPAMPAQGPIDGNATAIVTAIPSTTGGIGDARNWRRVIKLVQGIIAGRSAVITTDESLQIGPPPERIRRISATLNGGMVGNGINSFPGTAGEAYIPHIPSLPFRKDNATAYRGIDDNAVIPATYAGNPS
jgi:hypothetical protein